MRIVPWEYDIYIKLVSVCDIFVNSDMVSNSRCRINCVSNLRTHQGAQQVHSFQDQLLMSYTGHSKILQLLMGDPKQLVTSHLLSFKVLDILLQAVIQTCKQTKSKWRNDEQLG